MANNEEEQIIKPKNAPDRVRQERENAKAAKLTKRTHKSLKEKIQEHSLEKAYRKYNEYYAKMRAQVREGNRLVREKNEEAETNERSQQREINQVDIVATFTRANAYSAKLAKWAVKLLDEEIDRTVSVGNPKIRRVKGPKKLIEKMRVARAAKKDQKLERKNIKNATKENIRDYVDASIFRSKDSADITDEKKRKEMLETLKLKRREPLDSLKKFVVSEDNNGNFVPVFNTNPQNDESSEIGNEKGKRNPNVPPMPPESDQVKKTMEDLKAFQAKKTGKASSEVSEEKKTDESVKTPEEKEPTATTQQVEEKKKTEVENDKKADHSETTAQPEEQLKKTESQETQLSPEKARIKEEVDLIIGLQSAIANFEAKRDATTDPELRTMYSKYINDMNRLFEIVINTPNVAKSKAEEPKTIQEQPKNNSEESTSLEPVEVAPAREEPPKKRFVVWADGNATLEDDVAIKTTGAPKAEQISKPKAVRVTPEDLKNMENRVKTAQNEIETRQKEKEELLEQKALLGKYIEAAKEVQGYENEAAKLAQENESLRNEVDQLASEAASLGGRKI